MSAVSSRTKLSYCSIFSLQANETLIASATPTRFYFLLEYPKPWGSRALEDSQIDKEVQTHLKTATKTIPESKLLLIKTGKRPQKDFLFYFAVTEVEQYALYAFRFGDYRQLLDLDLLQMVRGDYPNLEEKRIEKNLLLVCTNGKRDACCAKFGLPVLRAAQEHLADDPRWEVWQSSHVGGHRFAPNVLTLPWGLLYGRIQPNDVAVLIEDLQREEISLKRLRGRTCWEPFVQAAEYHLRLKEKENKINAYRLLSSEQLAPEKWEVHFLEPKRQRVHHVQIQKGEQSHRVYESCQFDKTTPMVTYALVKHTAARE